MAGVAPATHAATIDTYDFTQGGYTSVLGTGVLTGSFTGTVEADGFIERADVSSMSLTFVSGQPPPFSVNLLPTFFSFDTAGGSSSLDFVTIYACVGAAAAFGAPGCGVGGYNGIIGLFTTQDLPEVTLVSSLTTVPEPSTWAMLLLGFAGLGFAGHRTSRKAVAIAA